MWSAGYWASGFWAAGYWSASYASPPPVAVTFSGAIDGPSFTAEID